MGEALRAPFANETWAAYQEMLLKVYRDLSLRRDCMNGYAA
jgi:hypothetical protein